MYSAEGSVWVLIVLLDFVCSKCQAFRHPPRPCPYCRSSELANVQGWQMAQPF